MQIDVDFDVFKALTNLRESESTTYNEVIRRLLKLSKTPLSMVPTITLSKGGCVLKGIRFPDGSQFRVTYKGRTYTAQIKDGAWVDEDGHIRKSPSDAAHAITHTNVNGWRFWECKRPSDPAWQIMDGLRASTLRPYSVT